MAKRKQEVVDDTDPTPRKISKRQQLPVYCLLEMIVNCPADDIPRAVLSWVEGLKKHLGPDFSLEISHASYYDDGADEHRSENQLFAIVNRLESPAEVQARVKKAIVAKEKAAKAAEKRKEAAAKELLKAKEVRFRIYEKLRREFDAEERDAT